MTSKEILKEAEKQLALYPQVAHTPEWHPYYWLGQRDAARALSNCSALWEDVTCHLEAGHTGPHIHRYQMQDWSWR